jgi:hypothetical protein
MRTIPEAKDLLMSKSSETFDTRFTELIEEAASYALHSEDAQMAMRNLETFSRVRPPEPKPEPTPDPVPTTRWGKVAAWAACVMNNETTRTVIKTVGTFAGVALVTSTTIRRDHVVERQALAQANQRPN